MKTLVLHCDCGNVQLFRGVDVQVTIKKIDASGWVDQPDVESKYGKGHAPGICPPCYEALPDSLAEALDAADGDIEL